MCRFDTSKLNDPTTLVIPDYVDYHSQQIPVAVIDNYCCSGTSIKNLTIGKNVTQIGISAFGSCQIENLTIPSSVTLINNLAFYENPLKTVRFEDPSAASPSLLCGSNVFSGTQISDIELPARIVPAYYSGTNNCANFLLGISTLQSITINPAYNPSADTSAKFLLYEGALCVEEHYSNGVNCTNIFMYPPLRQQDNFSVENLPVRITEGAFSNASLKSIKISSTLDVKNINLNFEVTPITIYNCPNLETLYLDVNGNLICNQLARQCPKLKSIEVGPNVINHKSVDGVLYKDDCSMLDAYPCGKTDESFRLPDAVMHIGPNAFEGCLHLRSLYLPDNLEIINLYAFSNASNLKNIEYNGNKLEYVLANAFYGTAFIDEAPAGEVYLKDWLVGYSGDMPENLTLPTAKIALDLFTAEPNIKKVTFPSDMQEIPEGMFSHCSGLSEVQLPYNVKCIWHGAFAYTGLKNIVLPSSLEKVGINAFYSDEPMSEIVVCRMTPPILDKGYNTAAAPIVFGNSTLEQATLVLPKGADAKAFTDLPYWSFKNIEFRDIETGVDTPSAGTSIIFNGLTVSSDSDLVLELIATDGTVLARGISVTAPAHGLYILRAGERVHKIQL